MSDSKDIGIDGDVNAVNANFGTQNFSGPVYFNTQPTKPQKTFMAPRVPESFVNRPTEFENLVGALVNQNGAVAITAELRGAGGFGKTTLAAALCADTRILGAFYDGILWVTLGEKLSEEALIGLALDLIYKIIGTRPAVESRMAAQAELQKAIGDRFILLVIDDVWHKFDAEMFMTETPNAAVLITTRFDHILPGQTRFKQKVDAMQLDEAIALLGWNIADPTGLEPLVKRLGAWPVLISLVNAQLLLRIERGETLAQALAYVDKALTRKGLTAFDTNDPRSRSEAIAATLGVSLELLTPPQREQFARLAVFPEDVDIPFTTLERLWGLDDFDTEEAAGALNNAALLQSYALDTRTIRLHDVVRQYLREKHADSLTAWQGEFVAALGDLHALPDEYTWRNVGYHMIEADARDIFYNLLTDGWIQEKFEALGNYQNILSDIKLCLNSCHQNSSDEITITAGLWGVHHHLQVQIGKYSIDRLKALVLIDIYIEKDGKGIQEALDIARVQSQYVKRFDYLFAIWETLSFEPDYHKDLRELVEEIDDPEMRRKKLLRLEQAINNPDRHLRVKSIFSDEPTMTVHQWKIHTTSIKNCVDIEDINFDALISLVEQVSGTEFDLENYTDIDEYLDDCLKNEGIELITKIIEEKRIHEAIYLLLNNEEISNSDLFEVAGLLAKSGCRESIEIYDLASEIVENIETDYTIEDTILYEIATLLLKLGKFNQAKLCASFIKPDLFDTANRFIKFIDLSEKGKRILNDPYLEFGYVPQKSPQALTLSNNGRYVGTQGAFNKIGLQKNRLSYLSHVASWHKGLENIEPNLSIKVIQEIVRVMMDRDPFWQRIQDILGSAYN